MRIAKACKTCGEDYTAIKATQLFCSRKCFRKDYNMRPVKDNEPNLKYPAYACPHCNRRSLLNFNPAKHMARFDAYECPYCGGTPRQTWNARHSYETRISLASFGAFSSTTLFVSFQIR